PGSLRSPMASFAFPLISGEQIQKTLNGVELSLRLRIELRRENRRRRMRGEKRKELVVDGRKRILLLQQLIDDDQSDHVLFDLEWHRGQRFVERDLAAFNVDVLIDVIALAGLRDVAEDAVAES